MSQAQKESYKDLAGTYRHFAMIQRELDAHAELLTHAQAAAHIKAQHDEEYRAKTPITGYWPSASNAARVTPSTWEADLQAAANSPFVKAAERAAAEHLRRLAKR